MPWFVRRPNIGLQSLYYSTHNSLQAYKFTTLRRHVGGMLSVIKE